MATAESVKAKIQGLINTVNSTTGGDDTDLTAAVNALIAGFGQGGGGVKVTEYVVTENADRGLWLNEQNIKLVKGLNLLISSKFDYTEASVTYVQGAMSMLFLLWDGVAGTFTTSTIGANRHLRGLQLPQNNYAVIASYTSVIAGSLSKITVAEDGSMTCTTSATGVTTGNYNNSFIEGGYTYRLLQVESEVVC